jgi:membrane protease YdiL (CAAX protease family)
LLEALFAGLVAVGLPARAWRRHRRGAPPAPAPRYVAETLVLTSVLAWLLWRRGVALEALGIRLRLDAAFLGGLLLCLVVIVGIDAWSVWWLTRRSRVIARTVGAGNAVFGDTLKGGRAPVSFALVSLCGAVWEELCFRATVFLLLPDGPAGWLAGICVGSLLFGAQHLRNGRTGFRHAAFYGVIFSLLFLATRNLIAVAAAHALGNMLAATVWAPRIARAQRRVQRAAPMFVG